MRVITGHSTGMTATGTGEGISFSLCESPLVATMLHSQYHRHATCGDQSPSLCQSTPISPC